jgi:anti-sigma B factor antagonist
VITLTGVERPFFMTRQNQTAKHTRSRIISRSISAKAANKCNRNFDIGLSAPVSMDSVGLRKRIPEPTGCVPVSINLTTRQLDDVSVVDVAGKITLGEGTSALRDLLHALVAEGHKKILLNLQNVTYIDSAGVGELVSGYTSLTNQGGTLKLLGLTDRVKDLLQITKLYTVFDVHEIESHAVRSFAAAG